MVTVSTFIKTGQNMKEIGKRISKTVKEENSGQMEVDTQAHIKMVRSMERAVSFGPMGQPMRVTGSSIKCMERDYLSCQMAGCMKENIRMILSMAEAFSFTLMDAVKKDIGRMVREFVFKRSQQTLVILTQLRTSIMQVEMEL